MILVGVAGGVASGKSAVANRLAAHGAVLLDADAAGHAVLDEPEVREVLRDRWGETVFDPRGGVDRTQVARRVFADPPAGAHELAFLESVTHPRIRDRLSREIEAYRNQAEIPMAVLDAAVMFKAGWDQLCDQILFVDCPREVRLARARTRGWDAAELARREASQWPLDTKRSRADWVIDNSTTLEHLFAQVDRVWGILVDGDQYPERLGGA